MVLGPNLLFFPLLFTLLSSFFQALIDGQIKQGTAIDANPILPLLGIRPAANLTSVAMAAAIAAEDLALMLDICNDGDEGRPGWGQFIFPPLTSYFWTPSFSLASRTRSRNGHFVSMRIGC